VHGLGTPAVAGLKLYEQLLHEGQRLPVIFLAASADVATAVAAMKMGALDFLEQPLEQTALLSRIAEAMMLDMQRRRHDERFSCIDRQIALLTPREAETLEMILAGDSNKQMAAKLFISQRAVEMRRSRLMRKLEVRSVAELLDLAVTHRVLSEVRRATQGEV
jgi:FixJ family two-component response regulator